MGVDGIGFMSLKSNSFKEKEKDDY